MASIEAPFLSAGPYARMNMAEMCVQCGEELAPESLFCTECGARQAYSPSQVSTPPAMTHQASVTDLSSIVGSSETLATGSPPQATEVGQGGVTAAPLGGLRTSGTPTIGEHGGRASDVLKGIAQGLNRTEPSPEDEKTKNAATMGIEQRREYNSPTDQLVEDINIADREVKGRQRQAWLEMNKDGTEAAAPQAVTAELPPHLREETTSVSTPSTPVIDAPDPALFRRMTEVAMRRVARKRGISVEAPQVKDSDGIFMVNLTYNDDGRVLDTPDELMDAFDHAITTEASLKGYDVVLEVNIFRNQDGKIERVAGQSGSDSAPEERKEREPRVRKETSSKRGKPPGRGRRKPPGGGRKSSPSRDRDDAPSRPQRGPSGDRPPGRSRGPSAGGPSRKQRDNRDREKRPSKQDSGGGGRGPPGGGGRGPPGGGGRGPPGGGEKGPGGRPPPGPQRGGRRGPSKSSDPEW